MKINRICFIVLLLLVMGSGNAFSQNEGADSQSPEQTSDAPPLPSEIRVTDKSAESESPADAPIPSEAQAPESQLTDKAAESESPADVPIPSEAQSPESQLTDKAAESPADAPIPSEAQAPESQPAYKAAESPADAPAPSESRLPENAGESETLIPEKTSETESLAEPSASALFPFFSENKGAYAIVVKKKSQLLFIYVYEEGVREIARMKCSTGKAAGPKNVAGDLKTPEGIYFFIKEHEKKELAPIYGSRAFPTDYPNMADQTAGKTGDSIWLHGTNKPLKPSDSSGCVVLENSNIDNIRKYITLNRTPFVITENFSHEALGNDEISAIRSLVSGWKDALAKGSYHEYLSFYDADYLPDISWWREWRKIRKTFPVSHESFTVKAKNMLIIRHKEIYVVLYDLAVSFSGRDARVGAKKFFLTRRGDQFGIIGETYQEMPTDKPEKLLFAACRRLETETAAVVKPPAPAVTVAADQSEIAVMPEITAMIADWLDAWSSKNIERYGGHYAQDFQSQGMNLKAWLAYKTQLNQKYGYIRVSKKNDPVIRRNGETLDVSFVQIYESDAFRSVGLKKLVLKHESGKWKIYRETSKKM